MSHKARLKGVMKSRGAKGGGISTKRANAGQRRRKVPMEVLLGDKPIK